MANFQVPQFIEEQPKIIGPLTLPQFLYIAGAAGLSLGAYYIFSFLLWIMITVLAGGFAIALAFIKVNGESLPKLLQSSIGYMLKPRTYTWQRSFAQKTLEVSDLEEIENVRRGAGFQEKLKTLALSIATGKIFSSKDWRLQEQREKYQAVTFLTGEKGLAKRVDFPSESVDKKRKK